MVLGELAEIREKAVKAAERDGVPFYILCNPALGKKGYTAVTSRGFGLPPGFYIEELIPPENPREEIDPPEKTSTNGF